MAVGSPDAGENITVPILQRHLALIAEPPVCDYINTIWENTFGAIGTHASRTAEPYEGDGDPLCQPETPNDPTFSEP